MPLRTSSSLAGFHERWRAERPDDPDVLEVAAHLLIARIRPSLPPGHLQPQLAVRDHLAAVEPDCRYRQIEFAPEGRGVVSSSPRVRSDPDGHRPCRHPGSDWALRRQDHRWIGPKWRYANSALRESETES